MNLDLNLNLRLDEDAARKIRTLMAKQGISEGGLRVGVKGGGCSGLSYTFAWERQERAGRRGVRRARRREDLRRQEEPAVPERHGARLRHEPDQQGVRVQQSEREDTYLRLQGVPVHEPEREVDLRLRKLLRSFRLHPPPRRFRTVATAAAARRSTCTSARSARRSCRSAATATTSRFSGCREAESRPGGSRAAVPHAQPAVSSRLLLQRDAGRAARQPRALVVPERRLPDAEAAGRASSTCCSSKGCAARGPRGGARSRCRRRCSRKCSR